MPAALTASSPMMMKMITHRRPSYPPPLPPITHTHTPPTPSTQDENGMPAPTHARQSFSSCGATVRYTPRRRNALVPLPLLPPIPPHVVVKRIAGVVCTLSPYPPLSASTRSLVRYASVDNQIKIQVKILAASNLAILEPKDVEMSPPANERLKKIQFPVVEHPTAEPESAPIPEPAPEPVSVSVSVSVPLRPRLRKDSLGITPRFCVPIPSDTTTTTTTATDTTPAGPPSRPIPPPPFPVRPLNFNNLPANRKPIYDPIVFAPIPWSRPRLSSPLNPAPDTPQLDSPSDAIPPHMAGLLSTPSNLPARAQLHPAYFLRARPRPATAILTPYGAWTLKATLARGGKSDELRRCALMTCESGRKLAWMGGDVRGAVEVWEAEQALEGMEDEEMEFDEDIEEMTQVYVQPCDENDDDDDDDDVVCTGERKAEEIIMVKKETTVVCCPFEFEGPTTCTELDIDMDCDVDMADTTQQTQKHTNIPATQGRTWNDVFEVEDDEDEDEVQC